MATKKTARAETAVTTGSTTSAVKTVTKKATRVTKAAPGAAPQGSPTTRKSPSTSTTAASAPRSAKKTVAPSSTQKSAAKKGAAKKGAAQKGTAQKATAQKTTAKKAAEKTAVKKTAQKAAGPAGQSAGKSPARSAGAPHRLTNRLRVKDDESPWSASEIDEMRAILVEEIETHHEEVRLAEEELDLLLRDSGDGAGDDQADAGSMTAERVHEIALTNNARASLEQAQHALEQLEAGTYGICENCGLPIGKLRLQARPRATLCMPCQAKQDRH